MKWQQAAGGKKYVVVMGYVAYPETVLKTYWKNYNVKFKKHCNSNKTVEVRCQDCVISDCFFYEHFQTLNSASEI